ncbi:MAG: radical SAM protein [Candidatus Thermoplasmatota archaeon]
MNILVVETVWMGKQKYHFFDIWFLTMFSILPTLSARQLAALTPKKHTVTVLNERYDEVDFHQHYDLVLIDFVTSTAPHAYELADGFRSIGIPVVLSGMHPSLMPHEAKQHADSVLIGPAETVWLELLSDAEQHRLQPFYYGTYFDRELYIPPTQVQLPGFVLTGAVQATRGCPYKCWFCPEASIPGSSQLYFRPVEEVVREIQKLPQKTFIFYDASLTINPGYTKELFRQMKGLRKHFFCNGNVDVLAQDEDLVRLSKEAGCISWLVGFESVDQRTLDVMKKKTNTVSEYGLAVSNIHKHHMAVVGCFMVGFDTDTPQIFQETLQKIYQLKIDVVDFCILTPFPGTPLFAELEREGRILTKDWALYTLKNVVFQPKNMSADDLIRGVQLMYADFYSIKNTIRRFMHAFQLGIYPFVLVVSRNILAVMNSRRIRRQ